MIPTVMIVCYEEQTCRALQAILQHEEYCTQVIHSGSEGIRIIQNDPPSLVLLNSNLPDVDYMDFLEETMRIQPDLPVIIISSDNSIESAIKAIKFGAVDYITNPSNSLRVKNAVEKNTITKHNNSNYLQSGLSMKYNNLIGHSRAMQEVKQLINQVAHSNANILISGESGTGKEVAAITIHQNSSRKDGPFVPINCAALPEQLMESELFGHEKGAFTGAVSRKLGRFEIANKGTIFLDEIAEMPLNMQAKLLRVLQEKAFERVGGTETLSVNVRIIAATNQQLCKAIESGTFREDLYYRLNVVQIHIPSLRERQEDIPELARHFVEKFNPTYGVNSISEKAIELLNGYEWPGNIRELQNAIERAAIICKKREIRPEHLPNTIKNKNILKSINTSSNNFILTFPEHGLSLKEVEKELLVKALEKTRGNQTRAAKLLGITRSAFLYRSQKHGIYYN
ncbi:MAG: sigma-54 dependent transcriptional regulator [Clostridiales bacterium]|nr:sigma-54 dependent transcriptional regulator [Clostridiales bacterium]MCF8021417.1 sigma-54 dependent transcriptional regulator [Clostridiales bacterium]